MRRQGPTQRVEIRITGFGGQGVVLAGHIIGRACAIHGGLNATMIQSFGPEARGGACSATLVVSQQEILYPYIDRPDILVAMSAEGYERYGEELSPEGLLLYEQDLVKPDFRPGQVACGIPSTRIAEEIGRALIQNVVMVGFFSESTHLVPSLAMEEAVRASVPAGTEDLNLNAFQQGVEWARRGDVRPSVEVTGPARGEVLV